MPPIPIRELTSTYARRYSNTARVPHGNFHMGMQRDIASWEASDGACWNAVDMITDIVGKIRKRGGYTSPSSSNRVAVVENLIGYKSGGLDGLTALYGSIGKTQGAIYQLDRTTGAATQIGLVPNAGQTRVGRPFQHYNWAVFPFQAISPTTATWNGNYFAGGGTGATLVLTAATVAAADGHITGIAGGSTLAAHVGCGIFVNNGSNVYAGRIIDVISTSQVRVEPTPTVSFVANNGGVSKAISPATIFSTPREMSGKFGISYQGRMVFANTSVTDMTNIATIGVDYGPNRVWWSSLSTDPIRSGNGILGNNDGDQFLYQMGYPTDYNYVDIPDIGPGGITGLAAAGEGTLLVFGRQKTFRISGPLSTETQLNPEPTYSRSQISANVGCIEARSIQYTPMGVIFAALDNLYLYDGAKMTPLLGQNAHYYQARLRAGDTIYGSAYFLNRNHYYLSMSGTDGGLMFNLDQMQMTRISNLPLFDSTPDPTDATQLWGVDWWDTTAAAPTFTKGQLIRLDPIFLPASTNTSDGNGTAVLHTFESKSYPDGELPAKKRYTVARFGFDQRGGTTTLVQADTQLNTSDASYVSVGSLAAGTEPQSVGFQTLPLLKKGQAIEFKLTSQAACTSFELTQLEVSVQQPRGGRSN